MNSDYLRGVTIAAAAGTTSVPAAGYVGNNSLETGWIDLQDTVGPVVVRGFVAQDANLSGTLSIQHATSAAGAGAATVTDDADILGGREANGINATGGYDYVAANGCDAAIAYSGDRRYVRGVLTVANASAGAVAKDVGLVAMVMPQVVPDSRIGE